ncbi:hypothetical protein V2J09_007999 [Rumex salicifolius]
MSFRSSVLCCDDSEEDTELGSRKEKAAMEGNKDLNSGGIVEANGEDEKRSGLGDNILDCEGLNSELELEFFLGLPGMSENAPESIAGVGSKRDLASLAERGANSELNLSIGASHGGCSLDSERLNAFSDGTLHGSIMDGFEVGESSASSARLDSICDRDLQNKRAKIDSDLRGGLYGSASSSAADGDSMHATGSCISFPNSHSICNNMMIPSLPSSINYIPLICEGKDNEEERDDPNLVQMDLSDDLLHMVFSFLDHSDLCRAAMVCKQWHNASAHEEFWKSLNFDNRNITASQFVDICHRYPRITEISGNHTLVLKAVSLLSNLEVLSVGKSVLEDTFFPVISKCRMLRSLTVSDCILGTNIQETSVSHNQLRRLQITKCRTHRISIRCPQLEYLSLKRSNMVHAVLNCPILHELDIGACHKLPDTAIRTAVTACPQLESLDMSNCSCLTDETLREIARDCEYLHILNASYCPNISLESVRFPMLTDLKLETCESITSDSMAAIAQSYMLEALQLDNCSLLTSVSLDLAYLKSISLLHCRKFVDLSLRCLMLSSVTVCRSAALNRIRITSNVLKKLVLKKQESLTSLSLQCQNLQEVDLSDCESLTNSIGEVFSNGGGCPMLKTLVLDNCENLTCMRLCSTSLVSLSLAGCRGVASLGLNCPNLEQIRLDGCDHLERASFCPVGLQSLNLGICPKLNTLIIEAPSMVLLELKGCGVLSEASINCPLLASLDASFCSQLKDDCLSATTATCPLIESLILMSCPSIGPDGLLSLKLLENLSYLDLSYTFLVDLLPVFESCMHLEVLKLQACKYLKDTSLEALYKDGALPALRELDLSYGAVCQSAIEELLACCTHLTHVSLNGCINMHDLDWGSDSRQFEELLSLNGHKDQPVELPHRWLQNLNCVGCPNIKKVYIPASAHCENLSSINLSLSINLKEVYLACSNLCFLNLSNCNSLEVINLECPRLTSLFLQSCNIDEEAVLLAISRCNMLETLDIRFCPKICSMSMTRFRVACHSLKRMFNSLSTN